MKFTIKPPWRNHGHSWGLEFPNIYGRTPFGWAIWNRHTGIINYISPLRPNTHGYEPGEYDCSKRSEPANYGFVDQDSVS